jgi:spermidine/putrescine transport system permease protein
MAAVPSTPAMSTKPGGPPRRSFAGRLGRALDRYLLIVYTVFAVLFLMAPVLVMSAFSFNDPGGKSNFLWQGFTIKHWLDPFRVAGLESAVFLSLGIAFGSTIIATALGTLIALGLARYQFRGRASTNFFVFLPMATPEIVLGASLLTLYVTIGTPPFFPLGFLTILIAHIMFNISYVVVTVRARLAGFPIHLEEAAMDLGATPLITFWKITFPLILPGITAAALLAFSLSIDDFVITNFTGGTTTQTFPMLIYAKNRIGIPPEVNVIGTIIFVTAVGFVALTTLWQRRQAAKDFGPADTFLALHRPTKDAG